MSQVWVKGVISPRKLSFAFWGISKKEKSHSGGKEKSHRWKFCSGEKSLRCSLFSANVYRNDVSPNFYFKYAPTGLFSRPMCQIFWSKGVVKAIM